MNRISPRLLFALGAGVLLLPASATRAALTFPFIVDFEAEEDGTPLVNGQAIDDEFGLVLSIGSDSVGDGSNHLGPTIFDTTPAGPNAGGGDPDLLVDTGNALILQNNAFPTQSVPGIFDTPNDEAQSADLGEIEIDFTFAVELLSIDIIDVNGGVEFMLTLTDTAGLTRTYDVPMQWSNDVTVSPAGFDTLLLTVDPSDTAGFLPGDPLHPLQGEGSGDAASVSEDAGFDPTQVTELLVEYGGSNPSGAIDNVVIGGIDPDFFIPEPSAAVLAALAGLFAAGRPRV